MKNSRIAPPQEGRGEIDELINSHKNNLEGYKTIPDNLPGCIGFIDRSILCLKCCNIVDVCGRSQGARA